MMQKLEPKIASLKLTEIGHANRVCTSKQTDIWFRNLFPSMNNLEMGIEKTPTYFDCSNYEVASRVKDNVPKVKILLIVCDPTARAFSDYVHQVILNSYVTKSN